MRAGGLALAAVALLGAAPALADPPSVGAAPPPVEDAMPTGPSLEARLAAIAERVQAVAEYPPAARSRGVEGMARVAFRVDADGRAVEVDTVESSGSLALDRAALRAVRTAGPLPLVAGRITVPVRFALVDAAPASAPR